MKEGKERTRVEERKEEEGTTSGKGDDANGDDAKASAGRLANGGGGIQKKAAQEKGKGPGGSCYGEQRQIKPARDRRRKLKSTGTITQSRRAAGGRDDAAAMP
jgi:hypothetical protein